MILECARTEKRMKPSQVFYSLELVSAQIKTENENIFQIIFALTTKSCIPFNPKLL
jgi:hypothetical protein